MLRAGRPGADRRAWLEAAAAGLVPVCSALRAQEFRFLVKESAYKFASLVLGNKVGILNTKSEQQRKYTFERIGLAK